MKNPFKTETMNTQVTFARAVAGAAMLCLVGCMNAGYKYSITAVKLSGQTQSEHYRLIERSSYGYYEMIALYAIKQLTKPSGDEALPIVKVAIKQEPETSESPLWSRIPSFATLTILPMYVKTSRHFTIELGFPEGAMEIGVDINGHGFVSILPTGFLPIPGLFTRRYWDAGPLARCGSGDFCEFAIKEVTTKALTGGLRDICKERH